MRVTKYECTVGLLLLVFAGCAAGDEGEDMVGSGGAPAQNFSNAGQGEPAHPNAGAPAPAGTGGASDTPNEGSGGSPAAAGKGGSGGGSAGGAAGMGAAGMGEAGAGAAGMSSAGSGGSADEEDPFAGLLPDDADNMNATPPDAAMCADAVCFDVFDCYLWHADIVDCSFTDCVDFVCQ